MGIKDVRASSSLHLLSLGLLVGLRLGEVTRQRRVVAIPQLVQLGGLVLAAAGAAVPETGQGGTQLGALGGHGALDGLTELRRKGRERREAWVSAPPEQEPSSSTWGGGAGIVWLMKDLAVLHVVGRKGGAVITSPSLMGPNICVTDGRRGGFICSDWVFVLPLEGRTKRRKCQGGASGAALSNNPLCTSWPIHKQPRLV